MKVLKFGRLDKRNELLAVSKGCLQFLGILLMVYYVTHVVITQVNVYRGAQVGVLHDLAARL
jgi:hypothetical protein